MSGVTKCYMSPIRFHSSFLIPQLVFTAKYV